MEKKIPTYRIVVNPDDDETGVYAVSLVDEPAIEVDWIKLAKTEEFMFSANKDKQMLFGPLLIPGKLIYRRDEKGREYNIVFDEDTIQTIADKYNENKLGDVFNFQHSDKKVEAVLLQNWITGEIDKSNEFGFSLPKGTWFGGVKVKDEGFWLNEIKTERVKGFSVEIMAGTELIEMTSEVEDKNKIKLMDYKTRDGLTISWDGAAEVGKEIFIVLEDGTREPLTNGEYELEDGTKIVVAAGKVAEIMAPETEDEELAEPTVEAPNASVDVLSVVEPIFEELRNVIAELTARLDKLENVENTAEEAQDDEVLSRVKELENKIEELSSMPGAKSISVKDDEKQIREDREKKVFERLQSFRKSTK
jgi:hypothetical protein